MFEKKQKPLHLRPPFVKAKPRPSRKKRVLIGTAIAGGIMTLAGVIEKGRDAQ